MPASPRHAFLIMAHSAPQQLELLLRSLDHERIDLVLHIDRKATALYEAFAHFRPQRARFCCLSEREDVAWGHHSQLYAELRCFAAAAQMGAHRHYHLLSGVDVLTRSAEAVLAFFDAQAQCSFLGLWNSAEDRAQAQQRVQRHYYWGRYARKADRPVLHRLTTPLRKLLLGAEKLLGYRRYPRARFRKSYNWCSLVQSDVDRLLAAQAELRSTYRHTLCADEIYKATLLLRRPSATQLYDEADPTRGSQRLVCFERGNPYTFQLSDLPELRAAPCCFARKASLAVAEALFAELHAR